MPLLSSSIPNLVNGVSQQAPALRLVSQLEAQENAYSSVVEGLGKRPPTQQIARLTGDDLSTALIHTINRDQTERYTVVATNAGIAVYGMDGSAKTVNSPDGVDYLTTTADPKAALKCLTVEDYTFVLNTEVEAAMDTTLSDGASHQSVVFVKQGQYSTDYNVWLDDTLIASKTTSATDPDDIKTDTIAADLATQLTSNTVGFTLTTADYKHHVVRGSDGAEVLYADHALYQSGAFSTYSWHSGDTVVLTGGTDITPGAYTIVRKINANTIQIDRNPRTSGSTSDTSTSDITSQNNTGHWTVTRQDNTLLITHATGSDFNIRVSDSYGDRVIVAFKDSIQKFSDLPTVAPRDYVVQVRGDNATANDNYYVKFVPNNDSSDFDKGQWVETVAPGIQYQLDAATMPHVLVREADGTFTFREAEWSERTVGDETTAPDPSFIGHTIADVFFFKGRLGLLSNQNTILSDAEDYFSFFPATVTTTLDTDPIDVASTHTSAAYLKHAVPFREQLVLFSEQAQFVLGSGNNILTPTTVSIDQATAYECSLDAKPVPCGDSVYFAFTRGPYAGMREMFIQPNTDTKAAADITAHVPKYLPGVVSKITATTTEDLVVALVDGDPDAMYVYKYYWAGDQKVQSSWSVFTFSGDILNADFIGSTLYLVVKRVEGCHLEKMDFHAGAADSGSDYVTLLDRRITEADLVSRTYDAGTNRTTVVLPYETVSAYRVVVRAGDASLPEGYRLQHSQSDNSTISVSGDHTGTLMYLGERYTMRCQFSQQVLHEDKQSGQAQIMAGRLQLRNMALSYDDTAYFTVDVTPVARDTSTYTFASDHLGSAALESGIFRFPVLSNAKDVVIEVESDSHLPCHFTGAEWEGFYHTRSQRA